METMTVTSASAELLFVRLLEGRCGSTVMMRLLKSSGDVYVDGGYPYESGVLCFLHGLLHGVRFGREPLVGFVNADIVHRLQRAELNVEPQLATREELFSSLLHHEIAAVADLLGRLPGPPRFYAEKWGGDSIADFARAEIGCRAVHLVRDPRDIYASIKAFDAKRGYAGFGRLPIDSDESYLTRLTGEMTRRLQSMREDSGLVDHLMVRYEDLVTDPDKTVRCLGGWLGIELDPRVVLQSRAEHAGHLTSADAGASIGRYRKELSVAEQDAIVAALGSDMERLGYQLS
jgi:hypothetical protein